VVSAGGGAVGGPLLRAALAARPLTSLANRTWRLLAGDNMPADELEQLRRAALSTPSACKGGNRMEGIIIEPARRDFAALLRNARLSISQGGYNTLIETLCLADRAVVVPFAAGLETEQTRRAALLAERGMIQVVAEDALAPQTLAAAVERALSRPSIRSFPRCDVGGGPASVALLDQALVGHRERWAS
jgi:predicted glycosyltransferase